MAVRVHIPSLLRNLYQTERVETVQARSVSEMVAALDSRYPGIRERILQPDGSLRRYVNLFVHGEPARQQEHADSVLQDGAEVWIVPNVAGGGLRRSLA